MSDSDDLPALQLDDRDLPVPSPPERVRQERVPPVHAGWTTYASQLDVRALAMSGDGELWAATAGGILRWRSRYCFSRYGSEHGLTGNSSTGIVLDGTDRAWAIAGDGRLHRYDDDVWRPYVLPADARPSCLATDPAGNVWAGTATGLVELASSTPYMFGGDYIPGEPPRAIGIGWNDDAWVCSAQGLFRLEDGRWRRRYGHRGILALAVGNSTLWLGTLDGLTRVDLEHDTVVSWKRGPTTALAIAAHGVWAASGGHIGLATESEWRPTAGSAPGLVTALIPASDDQVCAGTAAGLVRCGFAHSEQWSIEPAPDVIGLSAAVDPLIQAIAVGQRQGVRSIWIGTPAGLFDFTPATGSWRRVGGRRVRDVRVLATAGDIVWIGSWRSGLRELRDGNLNPAVVETPIVALAADTVHGRCFAAGTDAVYLIDGSGSSTLLTAEELQPGTWFRAIAAAEDGMLWIGTAAGLFSYAEDSGTTIVHRDLAGTDVRSVLSAGSGVGQVLLVGTARGLRAGSPSRLTAMPALADRTITALAWDEVGRAAWVGTHAGLARIARDQGEWTVTTELSAARSGMAADRVTAIAVGHDNQLWIGTPAGLSSYQGEVSRR